MKKELYRPVVRAIIALFLIVLVKLIATVILKNAGEAYLVIDIVLSLGVIIILLKFGQEFNLLLEKSPPGFPDSQKIVSGLIFLLSLLILYGTFSPYSYILPYGLYHIIFFFLALVPVYSLWNILYRNTDRLSDLFGFFILAEEKKVCSCGRENPDSSKFCSGCGSPLQE